MSSQIPDPRTFESWEDAFQYPIPAVSGMERKLRTHIKENHEKLRNLVGASYRDLLGTARTIVEADTRMQRTEDLLVDLGRKSDSRILDKISDSSAKLSRERLSSHTVQYSYASQLSLLQKSMQLAQRFVKKPGSALLAAKLILVGRSIYRTITKDEESALLSKLGDRLATLRHRLLRVLDKKLVATGSVPLELAADLTAFSLLTSSSVSDAVRHFQHLRLQAIKRSDQKVDPIGSRLQTYVGSQKEIRDVYPDLLVSSLKTVAARPLLQDPTITSLDELSLDIYNEWLPPEIKNFTPYTRYQEVSQSSGSTLLDAWTDSALKTLLTSLQGDVEEMDDVTALISLRKLTLQSWLSARTYKSSISPRQVLEKLRSLFTNKAEALCDIEFSRLLQSIVQPLDNTLEAWKTRADRTFALWDLSSASMDLSNAAFPLRNAIVSRRHGRSPDQDGLLHIFEAGYKNISNFQDVIQRMKDTRWEDDIDDEDEGEGDVRVGDMLSKEDPRKLHEALAYRASSFVDDLGQRLGSYVATDHAACMGPSAPGLYLLRMVRDLRKSLSYALESIDKDAAQRLVGQELVDVLHRSLVQTIAIKAEQELSAKYINTLVSNRHLISLWEGSPPLPVQLSPGAFRFFRALVKWMDTFGDDIWSPDVVKELRDMLNTKTASVINERLDQISEEAEPQVSAKQTNGTSESAADVGEKLLEQEATEHGSKADGTSREESEEPAADGVADVPAPDHADLTTTSIQDDHAKDDADEVNESQVEPTSLRPMVNGIKAASVEHEPSWTQDQYTQLLFDVLYMAHALPLSTSTDANSLENLASLLVVKANLSDPSLVKMRKSAADYWRKTYLLFGLLCP